MIEFGLNSNLFWHLPQPDCYNYFNCGDMFSDEIYSINQASEELEDLLYCYYFDKNKYITSVAKACIECYQEDFFNALDIVFELDSLQVSSPQYYNFETDSFSITCKISKAKLQELEDFVLVNNKNEFNEYLMDYNSSRDGFISFMPNCIQDLIECKESDFDKYMCVLLDFYAMSQSDDQRQALDDAYACVTENLFDYDFYYGYFLSMNIENIVRDVVEKSKTNKCFLDQLSMLKTVVDENIGREEELESFVYDMIVKIDKTLKDLE